KGLKTSYQDIHSSWGGGVFMSVRNLKRMSGFGSARSDVLRTIPRPTGVPSSLSKFSPQGSCRPSHAIGRLYLPVFNRRASPTASPLGEHGRRPATARRRPRRAEGVPTICREGGSAGLFLVLQP